MAQVTLAADPTTTPAPATPIGPPTEKVLLPKQVWDPFMTVFNWGLWFGAFVCAVAFVTCCAVLVNQRKSTGTQVIEDATLLRIMICAALIGSASAITNTILL